ncbi:MAG: hypothetical protein AB7D36_09040 [Oscillospiraceae bacterium]
MTNEQKTQAFKELGSKYNFPIKVTENYLILSAKDTDGKTRQWIFYELATGKTLFNGNTDNCNFWFGETRPDMTPDKIVQFVADLNTALKLEGKNRFSVKKLIDPEDWQEIAGVHDAHEDQRYTEEQER